MQDRLRNGGGTDVAIASTGAVAMTGDLRGVAGQITGSWLDTRPRPAYLPFMRRFSSILLLVFLATFVVGNMSHVVNANNMTLKMAAMDGSASAMEDCEECPPDGEGTAASVLCQLDCSAPGMVTLTASASFDLVTPAPRQDRPLGMVFLHRLRAPPDPFPPRTLI
tara:strand:- start:1587 stop:2084 length:498 start_codon:yes stop_codon:yes gene_type:complete